MTSQTSSTTTSSDDRSPTTDRPGRLLHTGPAIVDIRLDVTHHPTPGCDVLASASHITAGGGFNVMVAAARAGAQVSYLGPLGDGPMSQMVAGQLIAEGIKIGAPRASQTDIAYCVALVNPNGERSFVSYLAGDDAPAPELSGIDLRAADVVYLIGYSMLNAANRQMLCAWLPTLPDRLRVVLDASPMVGEIPQDAWQVLVDRVSIWTLSITEANTTHTRLTGSPAPANPAELCGGLAATLGRSVVLRAGTAGTWLAEDTHTPATHFPAPQVEAVDTIGAGDTHTGHLIAQLLAGRPLPGAVHRANLAAAIAVTRFGPATAPTLAEVEAALTREE